MGRSGRAALGVLRGACVGCAVVLLFAGCGRQSGEDGSSRGGRPGGRGGPPGGMRGGAPGGPPGFGGKDAATSVPVEVAPVARRAISSYIQTNGTLEAENEVDLVARTSGPITELLTEENRRVTAGQVLARLDADEVQARLEIARVELAEAEITYNRTKTLADAKLVSAEQYEQASARLQSARAQFSGAEVELNYTEIRAPFSGLVVRRYVRFAESVSVNQPLFRLSDFDPLLCPILVPERELPRLAQGQEAYLTVEAWGDERFRARVDRVSPVVDAETGTVRVTLEVAPQGKLRPGMFASVFLEIDRREDALVIPKRALVLDSLGDTVYVDAGGVAERRDIQLGFREADSVEVAGGLTEGESVVVIGQDGLANGTPIQTASGGPGAATSPSSGGPPGASGAPRGVGDSAADGPQRLERFKQRMRDRGMSEEEIGERVRKMRESLGGDPSGRPAGERERPADQSTGSEAEGSS